MITNPLTEEGIYYEFGGTDKAKGIAYQICDSVQNDYGLRCLEFKEGTAGDISYSNKETHERSIMQITKVLVNDNFITLELDKYWRHTVNVDDISCIHWEPLKAN